MAVNPAQRDTEERRPPYGTSRRSPDEQRQAILEMLISATSLAQAKTPPEGEDLEVIARSFEYALGHIPTQHLPVCFERAMRAKVDTYPLSAPEVNKQWLEYQQELLREGQAWTPPALPSGKGTITLNQFKQRHNLPADWKLGDPYPESSDLYNAPLPGKLEHEQPRYRCLRCMDAGWTRIPYDAQSGRPAKLIRCSCQA